MHSIVTSSTFDAYKIIVIGIYDFFFVLHFCCDEKRVLFDRYDKCFPGTFKIYLFFVQDHSRRLLTNHECTIPRFAILNKQFVSFVFCCLNFLKEASGFTTLQK